MSPASSSAHTSKLIKASALIPDTLALLNAWDPSVSVSDNLAMAQRTNLFGKASRSRVQDILVIFRQRYLEDPDLCAALVHLAQAKVPDAWLRPLLCFFTAQSDATLRDIVLEVIVPRREAGRYRVGADDVARVLSAWVAEGRTSGAWSEYTIGRVARGALATLRDFGVLRSKADKEIAGIVPPLEALLLIALWLYRRDDLERRVHDLKLTRQVTMQSLPQIRLVQDVDKSLITKIQSSVLTTIPVWKSQIALPITLWNQQKALTMQRNVTDTTNEMLARNAELLRMGSAEARREVERGIFDIETIRKVNGELITTIEASIQIAEEGRQKRALADHEMVQLEANLGKSLLDAQDASRRLTD